jgi:hypothetical protein
VQRPTGRANRSVTSRRRRCNGAESETPLSIRAQERSARGRQARVVTHPISQAPRRSFLPPPHSQSGGWAACSPIGQRRFDPPRSIPRGQSGRCTGGRQIGLRVQHELPALLPSRSPRALPLSPCAIGRCVQKNGWTAGAQHSTRHTQTRRQHRQQETKEAQQEESRQESGRRTVGVVLVRIRGCGTLAAK